MRMIYLTPNLLLILICITACQNGVNSNNGANSVSTTGLPTKPNAIAKTTTAPIIGLDASSAAPMTTEEYAAWLASLSLKQYQSAINYYLRVKVDLTLVRNNQVLDCVAFTEQPGLIAKSDQEKQFAFENIPNSKPLIPDNYGCPTHDVAIPRLLMNMIAPLPQPEQGESETPYKNLLGASQVSHWMTAPSIFGDGFVHAAQITAGYTSPYNVVNITGSSLEQIWVLTADGPSKSSIEFGDTNYNQNHALMVFTTNDNYRTGHWGADAGSPYVIFPGMPVPYANDPVIGGNSILTANTSRAYSVVAIQIADKLEMLHSLYELRYDDTPIGYYPQDWFAASMKDANTSFVPFVRFQMGGETGWFSDQHGSVSMYAAISQMVIIQGGTKYSDPANPIYQNIGSYTPVTTSPYNQALILNSGNWYQWQSSGTVSF